MSSDQEYNLVHHQFRKFSFDGTSHKRTDSVFDIAPHSNDEFQNLAAQLSLATLDSSHIQQRYESSDCLSPLEGAHPSSLSSRLPARRPSAAEVRGSRQHSTRLQSHFAHIRDIEALVDKMLNHGGDLPRSPTSIPRSDRSSPPSPGDDLALRQCITTDGQWPLIKCRRPSEPVDNTWVQKPIRARRKIVGQLGLRKTKGAGK
jgi:hypothetical protein